MARRRGRRGKRGTAHTRSVVATLFGITPALYVLTAGGTAGSPLGLLLGGGGSWQSLANASSAIAMNVINNWVAILILLAVAYVGIKVAHKLGRGARITSHWRA
jgi:hypothetical protein